MSNSIIHIFKNYFTTVFSVINSERLDTNVFAFVFVLTFFCGFHALFIGLTRTNFSKFFFKIGSHSSIHTFKNYFATVFSVSTKINSIQTDPKLEFLITICSSSDHPTSSDKVQDPIYDSRPLTLQ